MIIDYASRAGQFLPLACVHRDLLEKAVAAGEGDLDNAAVIRQYGRLFLHPDEGKTGDGNKPNWK
jgi:3-hydroxyisobutyrate dehydrogenase